MPRSLNMSLHPFLHRRNILLGVLEILTDVASLVAGYKAILGWFARLGVDGPATMLDASGDVIGTTVGFGVLQVEVFGAGGRVVTKESVSYANVSSENGCRRLYMHAERFAERRLTDVCQ